MGSNDPEPTVLPTATIWPTQVAQIDATDGDGATPWQFGSPESTPIAVTTQVPVQNQTLNSTPGVSSPASSPVIARIETIAPEATSIDAAASNTGSDGTSGPSLAGPAAATPELAFASPSSGTPVAATPVSVRTVVNCQPSDVPVFTGSNAQFVASVDLNVRIGPGADCDLAGDPLLAGAAFTVLSDPVARTGETSSRWVLVSVDGVNGWVALELIEPQP